MRLRALGFRELRVLEFTAHSQINGFSGDTWEIDDIIPLRILVKGPPELEVRLIGVIRLSLYLTSMYLSLTRDLHLCKAQVGITTLFKSIL